FKYDTIIYNAINYNCKRKNRTTEIPIKGAPTCYSIGCGYGNGRIVPYRIRGRGDWYFEILFAKKDADLFFNLFDTDFDSTIYYFQAFTDCGNNQIIVAQNRKYGIINYRNEIITPIIYHDIVKRNNSLYDYTRIDVNEYKYSLFEYMLNQKSGFLNYRGEVITPPIYTKFYFTFKKYSLVQTNDNKLVYIDSFGKQYSK
ncbi:MAG: hypothetical protein ABL940_08500, partial [Bacteroidia bacterium]